MIVESSSDEMNKSLPVVAENKQGQIFRAKIQNLRATNQPFSHIPLIRFEKCQR